LCIAYKSSRCDYTDAEITWWDLELLLQPLPNRTYSHVVVLSWPWHLPPNRLRYQVSYHYLSSIFIRGKTWERFLHARNLSVHDYLGISDADFSDIMSDFERALVELKVAKLTYK
jgi:hypothetical protein